MTPVPSRIQRLDLGYFVRPASETENGESRVEPVLGYLVEHPEGPILFDTGIGAADPETEAHYRPRRRPLTSALAAAGRRLDEIRLVVNCHLHFDHCGGNGLLAGRPILVQAIELRTARHEGYTFPELVDFPGAVYVEIDGESEIAAGVWLLLTAGHTPGHQSLVARLVDGTVVLAGQAHDIAAQYGAAVLARRAEEDGLARPRPGYPAWLPRLLEFDPRRVLFAHDGAVWEPA